MKDLIVLLNFLTRLQIGYGSDDGANTHLCLFVAYYNFLRPHSYTYWKPLNEVPVQDKGDLFIGPGTEVYEGMIVGLNSRNDDLAINVCKEKHLTNTRASGSDDALRLVPPIQFSLEKAIEFIQDDELVEVTPKSIRLRKKILGSKEREIAARRK